MKFYESQKDILNHGSPERTYQMKQTGGAEPEVASFAVLARLTPAPYAGGKEEVVAVNEHMASIRFWEAR